MKNPLCEMFGIDIPVFAFSHCRDVVAAVSKAGGMGVLGMARMGPERLREELRWIDEHVDGKPYGIDVLMPTTYSDAGDINNSAASDRVLKQSELAARFFAVIHNFQLVLDIFPNDFFTSIAYRFYKVALSPQLPAPKVLFLNLGMQPEKLSC